MCDSVKKVEVSHGAGLKHSNILQNIGMLQERDIQSVMGK